MTQRTTRRDANSNWFTFSSEAGNGFSVYEFVGEEKIHGPYVFSIELVHKSNALDISQFLGKTGCLSIADGSGGCRYVHGYIKRMQQLHTANSFTHYACQLVPRLDFLEMIRDYRIFQNLSVVAIISQILKEQGFGDNAVTWKLFTTYEPREYCVQYGETDLHFVARLCEEEGIFYYFEHSEEGHCLCFSDREGGPKITGESNIRFFAGSGQTPETSVINVLSHKLQTVSNAAAYNDWNFTKPQLDLLVKERETEADKAPVPEGMLLEKYMYPHIYSLQAAGIRYAKIQMLRQLTLARQITCESNVSRFTPGHSFIINSHAREDLNDEWSVVSTYHQGKQPGVLEHEAPSTRGLEYNARTVAIPASTRYIPENNHPKRRAVSKQTAIVTAPEGEEIFTDKFERVKVKFMWDRSGVQDERSSCWLRVSQDWAGNNYGSAIIPRAGHEVLVSFFDGDPDRPYVSGSVFNALNKPPYDLPEHKTRTYIRSMTTPGELNKPRGFNEIRIEDTTGGEEIFIHAERDFDSYINHDSNEQILHQRHMAIDNDNFVRVGQEEHYIGHSDRKVELHADEHISISGDSHMEYKNRRLTRGVMEVHYKSPRIILEAASDLTLAGGGSFLRVTPAGAKGVGTRIDLNAGTSCGSANTASPSNPAVAIEASPTETPALPWRGRDEKNT